MTVVTVIMASSRVGKCTILEMLQNETGVIVRAVFRSAEKAAGVDFPPTVEKASGVDFSEPQTHQCAFEGASKAFIIAPQVDNRDEIVNKFMESAKQYGVNHVVIIGGVFQEEEKFLFHKQWMSSRKFAESIGLAWTQLECSDFMENMYRNQKLVKEERKAVFVGKGGCSSPVSLSDIGKAAASILCCSTEKHYNRAYRVIGPEVLTPDDIVAIISKTLESNVEKVLREVQEAREVGL